MTISPLTVDDFAEYFEALWGRRRFEWQAELLERVCKSGWPSTLDLPTGAGKTAALDIALFALALDAFRPEAERMQSRRIALVVDRRVVVDQGYERAVDIAERLRDATDGILHRVAAALRALQRDASALPVLPAILRGGMPREAEWARTPHQPTLLVSTIDQVGSRLLFRGYGVSDGMKPLHAGLLGVDTLYLLDEVHLSRPFEETLRTLTSLARRDDPTAFRHRPLKFVSMSATIADRAADIFELPAADKAPVGVLGMRLEARKLARLRLVRTPRDAVKARRALVDACLEELKRVKATARIVAVIVNRVDTATQIAELADATLSNECEVRLVTGRMRPLDRDDVGGELFPRVRSGRQRTDHKLVLVSTQAIEAGADFDFDGMITECASLDALRQRFGRQDRMGELKETSAVLLASSSSVDDGAAADPIYGWALRNTWRWLCEGAEHGGNERVVDFGVTSMDRLLAALEPNMRRDLLAPRPYAPLLLPSHLDRWSQTSPMPWADPEVHAFLHGVDGGAPDVQVIWRADLDAVMGDTEALKAILTVVPPSALESMSLPFWTVMQWLSTIAARGAQTSTGGSEPEDVADVEGGVVKPAEPLRTIAPVVVWKADDSYVAREPDDLVPGATLLVPSSYGGVSRLHCWDPQATDPVPDRGDEANLRQRGRVVVRWAPSVLRVWASEELATGPRLDQDGAEDDQPDLNGAFRGWASSVLSTNSAPAWARVALRNLVQKRGQVTEVRAAGGLWRATTLRSRLPPDAVKELAGVRTFSVAVSDAITEGDESSFIGTSVPLDRHLRGVEAFAKRFAEALDLPTELVNDIAFAGRLHDLGKADPRFQLMLHGGDAVALAVADTLLAKSAMPVNDRAARERARVRSGYPKGMRHELMSVALIDESAPLAKRAHDWELVLHLVASHHGFCRPFAPAILDVEPVDVSASLEGTDVKASSGHTLARIDSEVPSRFWRLTRKYGWWALSWLEAIVRLADHRESEAEATGE